LRMGFAYGFSSVGFHLSFLRSMRAEYAGGVCGRSMRAEREKHFFDETIIIRMIFCYAKLAYIII
jgi:hypothetical protein